MTKAATTIMTAALLTAATSCVHEFPFNQGDVDSGTVVVEGYITNEYKRHTVRLSRLNSYSDTIINAIKGAFVVVTSGTNTYFYRETDDGLYESDEYFVGVADNVYYLHIELADSVVLSAESTMLPVTPPDKITFNRRPDGNLSISHIAESFVSDNPAKYHLQLSWEDRESHTPQSANIYYYSLTTVDIAQLFAPKLTETAFPPGTQIVERKYSVEPAYENYLRSLLAETRWSGGYFDEAHGNLQHRAFPP